jgi:hypothetical protein
MDDDVVIAKFAVVLPVLLLRSQCMHALNTDEDNNYTQKVEKLHQSIPNCKKLWQKQYMKKFIRKSGIQAIANIQ